MWSMVVFLLRAEYLLSAAVAVLDPVQVDHAEGSWGDARGSVVIVFINVQVKCGVTVNVRSTETRS